MHHTTTSAVRPDRGNYPVCLRKASGSGSCIPPARAKAVSAAVGSLETLPSMMVNAVGDWLPITAQDAAWNATSTTFGMPRGVRHLVRRAHLNEELGRDNAWLPVTHTMTTQHPLQVGLWFHYMRGCSDFAWNSGRTLLARNKCHASIVLERRAFHLPWSEAITSVAHRLVAAAAKPRFKPAWSPHGRDHSAVHLNVNTTASMIASCAAGRWDVKGEDDADRRLAMKVLETNALDYVSGAILAGKLNNTLDTIQFSNRCEKGSESMPMCDGYVEIWDVRSLQPGAQVTGDDWVHAPDPPAGRMVPYATLDGSSCALAPGWPQCLACSESESARACAFKCNKAGTFMEHAGIEGYVQTIYNLTSRFYERQGVWGLTQRYHAEWRRLLDCAQPSNQPVG